MNRKFILIGLLMAVFVFPVNDSFVSAKSCKKQKSKLRGDKKDIIRSLCEDILQSFKSRNTSTDFHPNGYPKLYMYDFTNLGLKDACEKSDWSVKTNPKGGCGKQKDHIRKRYNKKIDNLQQLSCAAKACSEYGKGYCYIEKGNARIDLNGAIAQVATLREGVVARKDAFLRTSFSTEVITCVDGVRTEGHWVCSDTNTPRRQRLSKECRVRCNRGEFPLAGKYTIAPYETYEYESCEAFCVEEQDVCRLVGN